MNRTHVRNLVIALVAGGLGLAVQSLAGPLAQVWPGRIVSLPVAILLGPWWGALSAAIALADGDGGRIFIVGIAEAVLVGVLARRQTSPLLAGALVWLVYAGTLAMG